MVGLPMYIGQVPSYEVVDGQLHVDAGGVCLVMAPHIFLAGCAAGKSAIVRWQNSHRDADVIPMRAPR